MKFKWKLLFFSLPVFFLAGCGSVKYQEKSFLYGGYSHRQINNQNFEIEFAKGLFSSTGHPADTDKIIVRRAAEITLQNGFTHFSYRVNPLCNSIQITCYYDDNQIPHAFNAQEVLSYVR